tara:strand:+ start:3127 stop:3258 length:132 start_codon:yes stop_codon:yes gene_type:complete
MRKKRKDILKELKPGDPIPGDFWKYNINIVLGYKHNPIVLKKK